LRGCEKIGNASAFVSFLPYRKICKSLIDQGLNDLQILRYDKKSIKIRAIADFFTATALNK